MVAGTTKTIADIYEFDTTWTNVASFTGQATATDNFGCSIALNEKTGMIIIGSSHRGYDDSNTNFFTNAGAAFTYLKDTTGKWTTSKILVSQGQDANPGDLIGQSISADGNVMAIGSRVHAYDDLGYNYLANAGAVWVWRYSTSTSKWALEQKIVPSDRTSGDNFEIGRASCRERV